MIMIDLFKINYENDDFFTNVAKERLLSIFSGKIKEKAHYPANAKRATDKNRRQKSGFGWSPSFLRMDFSRRVWSCVLCQRSKGGIILQHQGS
jgi:hypothetical protein